MAEDFKSFFFTKAEYPPFKDNDILLIALKIGITEIVEKFFLEIRLFFLKNTCR